MIKSQASALVHVLNGVFKDIRSAYPALKGISRDIERTALCVESRGLGFFTLDLPVLDSLLTKGLESGSLVLSGPLTRVVSGRVRVPRFLSGLWLRVFDRDARLRPEPDVNAILFLRQIFCLGKRLLVEPSDNRRKAVIQKYHDIERGLRNPSLSWDCDDLTGKSFSSLTLCEAASTHLPLFPDSNQDRLESYRILRKAQQIADLIVDRLSWINPELYSEQLESQGKGIGFKHGPGAVSERLRNEEKSDFLNWPMKLEGMFPFETCGKTVGNVRERPSRNERPSRLICVPKTAKGPRLIAAEPAAHQWCQQLVWRFMEDEIRRLFKGAFINFRKQQLSGELVLSASLSRDLATVDLSDASDRLTCWTVERVFRRNPALLRSLHAARTRYLMDETSSDRSFLKLRKFASQGTATTFPVQSFVFLILALASSVEGKVTWDNIMKQRSRVRVYGDDIIIPRRGYVALCKLMDLLQLKVNKEKSFVNGHFRESCGIDGYKGYDVTPVHPQCIVPDGPASCESVLATSNNLFNKGFWYASESVRELLPVSFRLRHRVVARHDAGLPGLTSFCGGSESHLQGRWNSRLHRIEVRVPSIFAVTRKETREGWSPLLEHFARSHNTEHARIVSEYGVTRHRRVKSKMAWEPAYYRTYVHDVPPSRTGSKLP
jgi:hypothetical protein